MIYFGGHDSTKSGNVGNNVVEYKNSKWSLLGHLIGGTYNEPRLYSSSITMNEKIYLFGGIDET